MDPASKFRTNGPPKGEPSDQRRDPKGGPFRVLGDAVAPELARHPVCKVEKSITVSHTAPRLHRTRSAKGNQSIRNARPESYSRSEEGRISQTTTLVIVGTLLEVHTIEQSDATWVRIVLSCTWTRLAATNTKAARSSCHDRKDIGPSPKGSRENPLHGTSVKGAPEAHCFKIKPMGNPLHDKTRIPFSSVLRDSGRSMVKKFRISYGDHQKSSNT